MIKLPKEYSEPLEKIIEWHLKTYVHSYDGVYLKRIQENFFKKNLVDESVVFEDKDMFYIFSCMQDAVNYPNECGYSFDYLWDIYAWVNSEYKKVKNQYEKK